MRVSIPALFSIDHHPAIGYAGTAASAAIADKPYGDVSPKLGLQIKSFHWNGRKLRALN
jgi:hypothetical protein